MAELDRIAQKQRWVACSNQHGFLEVWRVPPKRSLPPGTAGRPLHLRLHKSPSSSSAPTVTECVRPGLDWRGTPALINEGCTIYIIDSDGQPTYIIHIYSEIFVVFRRVFFKHATRNNTQRPTPMAMSNSYNISIFFLIQVFTNLILHFCQLDCLCRC